MYNFAMHEVSGNVWQIFEYMTSDSLIASCSLPATRKGCVKCSDMVDNNVKCLYCFVFLLEDEEGNNLLVSISGEEVNLGDQSYIRYADNSVTVLVFARLGTSRST